MSDFVNEFWNWYVILGVLASILACGIILWIKAFTTRYLRKQRIRPGMYGMRR